MRLEDQVCSLEYSKKLKNIGVNKDSYYVWITVLKTKFNFIKVREVIEPDSKNVGAYNYPAFTASELGELLPNCVLKLGDESFDNYRINIRKFISIDSNMNQTNSFIINYECDSTKISGEEAWLRRKLTTNIYDPNLANAMAKMLIYLIENNLWKL